MDEDTDVLKFNRKPVKVMTAAQFDEKYGARPYLQKNLRDWAFQDVLDFFRRSVTNDRKCIELITTREVDGSIIDKLNDDEEMARTLNMQPIHVRKFRIKMKQVEITVSPIQVKKCCPGSRTFQSRGSEFGGTRAQGNT